jgi:hypothetical protein
MPRANAGEALSHPQSPQAVEKAKSGYVRGQELLDIIAKQSIDLQVILSSILEGPHWSRPKGYSGSTTTPFIGEVDEVAQDQYVIKGSRGRGEEIFRAQLANASDPQSESADLFSLVQRLAQGSGIWNEDVLVESPPASECLPPEIDSELSASTIANGLLELDLERDKSRLRELIILAEDREFSTGQNAKLAKRLLDLALAYRDSNDMEDEPVVWAAIRTGASMLRPTEAPVLLPLLEPGHTIETSLVAMKMLGRIFEAYPPTDIDQNSDLVRKVREIVDSLLNRYAVAMTRNAAMVQLAVYALVAMGAVDSPEVIQRIRELDFSWFTRATSRKLHELLEYWRTPSSTARPGPLGLLEDALKKLES